MSTVRVFTLPEALAEIDRLQRLVAKLYHALTAPSREPLAEPATASAETAVVSRKRAHKEPDELIIYSDGSCLGNGKMGARAGSAVITNRGFLWQGRLAGVQTSNRGELYAAIVGLAQARDDERVVLNTDSEYVANGMNEWLSIWLRNGWKKKNGEPVMNRDLWSMIVMLVAERRERTLADARVVWVKAHAGNSENERVDALAKEAAEMPLSATAPLYPPFPGSDDVLSAAYLPDRNNSAAK